MYAIHPFFLTNTGRLMTHFGVNSSNDFGNIEYVDNNLNTSLTFYSWYFTSYSFQRGVSAYICFKGSLSILPIQALTSNGPGENTQGIKKLPPTTQGGGTGSNYFPTYERMFKHLTSCTVPNWTPQHISVRAELWLPVCVHVRVWWEILRTQGKQDFVLHKYF